MLSFYMGIKESDFFFHSEVFETTNVFESITGSKVRFHPCRSEQGRPGKPFNKGGGRGGAHGDYNRRYVKFTTKYMI
jgi:hypothetical protein